MALLSFHKLTARVAWAAVVPMLVTVAAHTQARQTADKQVRLQVFGLGSYVRPDYAGSTKNAGGTVGASAGFTIPVPHVEPFIEARAVGSYGTKSNQYVYSVGPRIAYNFERVRPYADIFYGYGKIVFKMPSPPTYTQDNASVWTYGGGVDYDLSRTWAFRADVQQQSWTVNSVLTLKPLVVSAGLRYQFVFRSRFTPD